MRRLREGIDLPGERTALAGCLVLALFYAGCLVWLEVHDQRFGRQFFARRQAVRLQLVKADPIPIGQPVAVATNGELSPHLDLITGWSEVEPWGVWSVAHDAELAFSLPKPYASVYTLSLHLVALSSEKALVVDALAGQRQLGQSIIRSGQNTMTVRLLRSDLGSAGLVRIDLRSDRLVKPSGDDRHLGIGLQALAADPLP